MRERKSENERENESEREMEGELDVGVYEAPQRYFISALHRSDMPQERTAVCVVLAITPSKIIIG